MFHEARGAYLHCFEACLDRGQSESERLSREVENTGIRGTVHLVPGLKVSSGHVLQWCDHIDGKVVDHEWPSKKGQDRMLVDPGFGGTSDPSGVYFLHPGFEFPLQFIHDFAFCQRGVDLAANILEVASAQKVHGLSIDRDLRVISSIRSAMIGVVLREKSTVTEANVPTFVRFRLKAVGPGVDLLQTVCCVLAARFGAVGTGVVVSIGLLEYSNHL